MTELLAVVTITVLAVISPGADFAMVTRNSLVLSRRAGILTAMGIGLGVLVHIAYTMLGVGLLIKQSLWMFQAIKLAGAVYLVYLGMRLLLSRPGSVANSPDGPPLTDFGALRAGFFTNVLNPKTTVFIVSLFIQVVDPATAMHVQFAYGAFISLAHVTWFVLVALFFSADTIRERLVAVRHWIDRAFGCLLAGFGVLLATSTPSR
ncbi:MAG TPA: LysE family transporter [Noviherbaspirillum sp.]|uniref:LysE family translocator n=1 Tax=Noviherbaspirillum sp. TaxID=1926288 RepID=UPI002D42D358|nr:LysE family transporter [Noviherbaspirillum sp.]HYD95267.1 LysE family transporter [Noviherbaspirillum sp.]